MDENGRAVNMHFQVSRVSILIVSLTIIKPDSINN